MKSIFKFSSIDKEEVVSNINKVIGCITADFDKDVFSVDSSILMEDDIIKVIDEHRGAKITVNEDSLAVDYTIDELEVNGGEIASARSDKHDVIIKELPDDDLVNVYGRKFTQKVVCANRCVIKQSSRESIIANSFSREGIRFSNNNSTKSI